MTGGRPWKPRDCGCTNASPPWPPAWTGWPKKGAAARTAKPPEAAEDGLAGHGSAVAGAAGGVRVGVAGSPHPGDKGPGTAAGARRQLGGLLGAMQRHRAAAGSLAAAVNHFLKVSRSYWPGLFHCYAVPDLPRTNNDLEHFFGSHRYHERRASGRKVAAPSLVLRGEARL